MNPNQPSQQQQLMRVPKQEMSRRYVQQNPPNRPSNQRSNGHSGDRGSKNGKSGVSSSSVMIEEVPNNAYLDSLNNHSNGQYKVDEDKLPVFLIKLWNIVEDSNLQAIVHWDDSGASFHISDPYSFCRNVLPHFFKHNNLNSLIRQLNMYGFRKMTPLSQGGLTRTESDQDHLEFSHPCFVQGRPELLSQIKRKQSTKVTEDKQVSEQTQQSLDIVMAEMRAMREKAKNMEDKMNKLTKENRDMWSQMGSMRQQHARQQQYFKKLLHFLVSVMQPGLSKRVAKRGVLGIDFGANSNPNGGGPNSKRPRMNSEEGPYKDVCELLESLQRESQEPFTRRFTNNDHEGPLISEVTDEFGNSPAGRGAGCDMFPDPFCTERPPSSRYSDAPSSREQSPHPIISQPSSSQNMNGTNGNLDHKPHEMYMGSGALTHENIHRGAAGAKRDYQGHQMTSPVGDNANGQSTSSVSAKIGQKRAPYKHATRHIGQNQVSQDYQGPSNYGYVQNNIPAQLTYQPAQQQSQNAQKLMAIEDQQSMDPHQNLYSPTLGLSPSFDRQLSQELQEYLTGMDTSMDTLRDMVTKHNWDSFGDNLPLDDDEDEQLYHHQQDNGTQNGQSGSQGQYQQYPLALKNVPESSFYDEAGDLLDPLLTDNQFPENGFQVPDANYMPLADEEIFPHSPVLRTPSPSDTNLA
ncbi:hypothetical protein GCK72_001604 [Caenorhabditis remanei]|uniref:HSF-type DNA-binding domain-containing protein n=1 Tax=Caenorhabditis remanei TaxID=31234 RepID=A0A6A5HTY1_CAERE|nr:hypothetical protein GCK72_001604 [Caenorhabditis remanei]KAF1769787.1 hypothetical protein GCK72_001604 [Caenorhabditis remanei]